MEKIKYSGFTSKVASKKNNLMYTFLELKLFYNRDMHIAKCDKHTKASCKQMLTQNQQCDDKLQVSQTSCQAMMWQQ